MSEVRLVVRDAQREIKGNADGGFADRVIAALSAEPETTEELEAALVRFQAHGQHGYFWGFSPDGNEEPGDTGLVLVDLAARLVICDSSEAGEGSIEYHDGQRETDLRLNYLLSDDWLITEEVSGWRALAEKRRLERRLSPPLDVRAVLYGEPLLRFIAERCFEQFRGKPKPKLRRPEGNSTPGFPENVDRADREASLGNVNDGRRDDKEYDLIREIHVRWMMTPREDLRGQTPRQVMMSRHKFVATSLEDRKMQWSYKGECPPGLHPNTAAYRFAGFGTHEIVVYYDVVRELLWRCRDNLAKRESQSDGAALKQDEFLVAEMPDLARFREKWLDEPYSDCGDRTAREIIHNERARIPQAESGHDAIIEDDCPLCRMQAQSDGPMFWGLDGCNMDDDFAFSIWHDTYEEWEEEQREYEDFACRCEAKEAERERQGSKSRCGGFENRDSIWKTSYSAPDCDAQPLSVRLLAIGGHLGELTLDLKEKSPGESIVRASGSATHDREQQDLIDRLLRTFGSLCDSARSFDKPAAAGRIRSGLADFCLALEAVREARADLAPKCIDLRDRARRFLTP